jgi:signal transduction histidine kinase
MGHDINNLNQVVLSNLDLAQQTGSLNDRQRGFMEGAKRAIDDGAEIIKDVKVIQAATVESPELRKVDLNDIIMVCIKEARGPRERPMNTRYTPHKGRIVNAVPDIARAYCNIIKEAFRNARSSVDIDVGEVTTGGKISYVTTVADDGAGIPDYVKQTLFTRFQHGSPVPPGKGLGLYTAKVLVETSGGTVEVGDRVPGDSKKGTRIVITLPAASTGEGP